MSFDLIMAIVAATIVIAAVVGVILLRKPKKLNKEDFSNNWRELQSYCKDKQTWPAAIEKADKLLDKALKRRRYKGETMGARMVSAQKTFSDNDGIWFAHNLYKKILAEPKSRVKESDIKDALVSYRQGLRDLGALPDTADKKPLQVEK